jgi:hypothetical protein
MEPDQGPQGARSATNYPWAYLSATASLPAGLSAAFLPAYVIRHTSPRAVFDPTLGHKMLCVPAGS